MVMGFLPSDEDIITHNSNGLLCKSLERLHIPYILPCVTHNGHYETITIISPRNMNTLSDTPELSYLNLKHVETQCSLHSSDSHL